MEMKSYLNCGLYDVNLEGATDGEYDGKHPTLIIQTAKEPNMYFVIPFTTYTIDRWNKMKKYMCCRVMSTNSIARIDKMEVINSMNIGDRWISNKSILKPTPDDIDNILKYSMTYLQVSCRKAKDSYVAYFSEYNLLSSNVNNMFINEKIINNMFFQIKFDNKNLYCSFNMKLVSKLSKIDIQDIFDKVFERKNTCLRIDKNSNTIHIIIKISDKNVLTFKSIYDKL